MKNHLFTAAIAVVFGFVGAAIWAVSGLGDRHTRNYLIENPQILPDMAEAWERQQSRERLAEVSGEVGAAFPGAVLGNPEGARTLVKFTDYACGFCKTSVPDVERLIAADPELRVVVREWPIFSGSEEAARMALAAAEQGRYAQFYAAMFELGPPSPETVTATAQAAGLDIQRARQVAASDDVSVELARNQSMARQLGFTGTPSWVAGDSTLEGAVGHDRLAEALAEIANES